MRVERSRGGAASMWAENSATVKPSQHSATTTLATDISLMLVSVHASELSYEMNFRGIYRSRNFLLEYPDSFFTRAQHTRLLTPNNATPNAPWCLAKGGNSHQNFDAVEFPHASVGVNSPLLCALLCPAWQSHLKYATVHPAPPSFAGASAIRFTIGSSLRSSRTRFLSAPVPWP